MLRALGRQAVALSAGAEQRAAAAVLQQALAACASGSGASPSSSSCSAAGALQHARAHSTEHARSKLFSFSPRSLEFPRLPADPLPGEPPSLLRRVLLTFGGFYSKESTYMRAAQGLFQSVVEQGTNPALAQVLGLPPGFQSTHTLLSLHVWLLLCRLRPEGQDGKVLAQALYDDFQSDVEDRVRLQKQLTELEKQFYGSSMAYDRAMAGMGEELWQALHRNVYAQEQSKQGAAQALERYLKMELACLAMTPSASVLGGNVRFFTEFLEGVSGGGAAAGAGGAAPGAAPAPAAGEAAPAAGAPA
eukprot:scaffold22.g6139.t1